MAQNFGSLVFTPAVQALQERYGSRRRYARVASGDPPEGLGPDEKEFLAARDSFYMASIGSTGWPYVQHRGGPPGFLKVIDGSTIAFGDFQGNKQYISAGNLGTDDRVALIMVDYPMQARLKILGRVKIFEGAEAAPWLERVRPAGSTDSIERVFVIHVEAYDWNCPKHIVQRFTAEQIQEAVAPMEQHIKALEAENEKLRRAAAQAK
jgi:uncharacterized protein